MAATRVSIRSFLLPYLQELGAEIGTSDLTEIVTHVITEHRRAGVKVGCTPSQSTAGAVSSPAKVQGVSASPVAVQERRDLLEQLSGVFDEANVA